MKTKTHLETSKLGIETLREIQQKYRQKAGVIQGLLSFDTQLQEQEVSESILGALKGIQKLIQTHYPDDLELQKYLPLDREMTENNKTVQTLIEKTRRDRNSNIPGTYKNIHDLFETMEERLGVEMDCLKNKNASRISINSYMRGSISQPYWPLPIRGAHWRVVRVVQRERNKEPYRSLRRKFNNSIRAKWLKDCVAYAVRELQTALEDILFEDAAFQHIQNHEKKTILKSKMLLRILFTENPGAVVHALSFSTADLKALEVLQTGQREYAILNQLRQSLFSQVPQKRVRFTRKLLAAIQNHPKMQDSCLNLSKHDTENRRKKCRKLITLSEELSIEDLRTVLEIKTELPQSKLEETLALPQLYALVTSPRLEQATFFQGHRQALRFEDFQDMAVGKVPYLYNVHHKIQLSMKAISGEAGDNAHGFTYDKHGKPVGFNDDKCNLMLVRTDLQDAANNPHFLAHVFETAQSADLPPGQARDLLFLFPDEGVLVWPPHRGDAIEPFTRGGKLAQRTVKKFYGIFGKELSDLKSGWLKASYFIRNCLPREAIFAGLQKNEPTEEQKQRFLQDDQKAREYAFSGLQGASACYLKGPRTMTPEALKIWRRDWLFKECFRWGRNEARKMLSYDMGLIPKSTFFEYKENPIVNYCEPLMLIAYQEGFKMTCSVAERRFLNAKKWKQAVEWKHYPKMKNGVLKTDASKGL